MPYSHPSMHRIGPTNSDVPTHWSFSTADAVADVNTEGYFNDASDDLTVNDLIFCVSSTGGTPVHTILIVASNTGGVVDVSDGLVITATDSD